LNERERNLKLKSFHKIPINRERLQVAYTPIGIKQWELMSKIGGVPINHGSRLSEKDKY